MAVSDEHRHYSTAEPAPDFLIGIMRVRDRPDPFPRQAPSSAAEARGEQDVSGGRSADRHDQPLASTHALLISTSADLRSDMRDFGPSCFHSASTDAENANAAPEGGA